MRLHDLPALLRADLWISIELPVDGLPDRVAEAANGIAAITNVKVQFV